MGQERLIKSVMAESLMWAETEERPVDRIAAIGLCMKHSRYVAVGDAMLRVDALDGQALRKVVLLVIRRLNKRYKVERGFAQRIAIATLHELLRTNCIHCGGKGVVHVKGSLSVTCTQCDGTGLHRYTDRDRQALVRGNYKREAYEDALNYLRDSVVAVVSASNRRLAD